jgi:hypothetical protein
LQKARWLKQRMVQTALREELQGAFDKDCPLEVMGRWRIGDEDLPVAAKPVKKGYFLFFLQVLLRYCDRRAACVTDPALKEALLRFIGVDGE